jgi:alpha-beta hydrolase superfamily lysophospholipase
MNIGERERLALDSIDVGYTTNDRTQEERQTVAIVHGLLAIAEAIERVGELVNSTRERE